LVLELYDEVVEGLDEIEVVEITRKMIDE